MVELLMMPSLHSMTISLSGTSSEVFGTEGTILRPKNTGIPEASIPQVNKTLGDEAAILIEI